VILIAFRHGLRASEVRDLRWDQVDFIGAVLHVRRQERHPEHPPHPGRLAQGPAPAPTRERDVTIRLRQRAGLALHHGWLFLDIRKFNSWPGDDQAAARSMFGILDEVSIRLHFASWYTPDGSVPSNEIPPERARLYWEAKAILSRLANACLAPIAHHPIQTLETFIPLDSAEVFELIARSVKSSEQGGYGFEPMAADFIVRIVPRYLAHYGVVLPIAHALMILRIAWMLS
jgi:hypothetical protein